MVLGNLRALGVQRRRGELVPTRAGAQGLDVDFGDGDGPTVTVTNPWRADLVASVPAVSDLRTFMTFPAPVRVMMRVPHGSLLRRVARRLPEGPSGEALERGHSAVWARASTPAGDTATAVLHGPDAYRYTAASVPVSACSASKPATSSLGFTPLPGCGVPTSD